MNRPDWVETPIAAHHDRKAFDCGEPELNLYLQRYARQNHRAGSAKCFVVIDRTAPSRILGYYTLGAAEIVHQRAPDSIRRGLGRHSIPVFRLGRLAVDRDVQHQGLGRLLLFGAGERALLVAAHVGGLALLIDAKSDTVAAWYRGFGAVPLEDAPLTLVLPLKSIENALRVAAGPVGPQR